jgi:hypothetical protein
MQGGVSRPDTPQRAQPAHMQGGEPTDQGGGQIGVYGQSAGAFNNAMGATTPGGFGQRTAINMNPFQSQVTNRTMQDMERQRQMQINDIGASASAAGAFGGSRHGVAEAETNRGFADQFADTAANMNMQNFNNAQNLTMQQAGLSSQLAGQGFGFGEAITDRQTQQGAMQQAMQQALIDAGRGQFEGFAGQPGQSLQYPLAAIGGVPQPKSETKTEKPGLFNYLTLAMGM